MSGEYDGYTLPDLIYKEDTPELMAKRAEIRKKAKALAARLHQETKAEQPYSELKGQNKFNIIK